MRHGGCRRLSMWSGDHAMIMWCSGMRQGGCRHNVRSGDCIITMGCSRCCGSDRGRSLRFDVVDVCVCVMYHN